MGIFNTTVRKIFGTQNDRELKSIQPLVVRVNEFEKTIKPLSNTELQARTAQFKERVSRGESLDSLLPEAFAVVREAAWRTLGQRHYDVQLIGGITLHRGRIAEMRTGEGKTLVATLPSYLNGLSGRGVHVVTVNDYLAKRDAIWMGQIHQFLGLKVGIIVHGLDDQQRQTNYGADITYGTNNEFGFDYLRDNMKFRIEDYVQRELNFAIVDEVDSILIDEARTPLIISGPSEDSTDLYYKIDKHIRSDGGLIPTEDYTIDEKSKSAALTLPGVDKMERRLGIQNLYDPMNIEVLHHVNQALRAHVLYKLDVDYVVQNGEVMIVDEFTGRLMPGRRWSDGLHQAIEAKEGVDIESENQTLATITFQNYFRMYNKLSGMTGTADTEATEFKQIYKLDVSVIPTNRDMVRIDNADMIYKTETAKFRSIAEEIKRLQTKGQPVLVGTISVEKSERLSTLLKKDGVRHHVLNAKQHEREAEIVAQAGRKGAVTIATNMAGRGTDILLGGNPQYIARAEAGAQPKDLKPEIQAEYQKKIDESIEKWKTICAQEHDQVIASGGLFILGTERHESRRIDNQLRGRSGRQGDPGESRFYLSLEDDLMRIFGSVKIARFMEDDVPIEHKYLSRAIENAQKKVEGHNYDIRKHLLQYDDVMNEQRQLIDGWRREVLTRENLKDMVLNMTDDLIDAISEDFFPGGKPPRKKIESGGGHGLIDMNELKNAIATTFYVRTDLEEKDIVPFTGAGLKTLLKKITTETYEYKERELTPHVIRQLEKMILLSTIDHLWKDHLLAMDHLREGIGLQGYGQKDPLIEYKKQGFHFFSLMMQQINSDAVQKLYAVQLAQENAYSSEINRAASRDVQFNMNEDGGLVNENPVPIPQPAPRDFSAAMARKSPGQITLSRGAMAVPPSLMDSPMAQASKPPPSRETVTNEGPRVGRNDPCPCGSGKKFKKCHGS